MNPDYQMMDTDELLAMRAAITAELKSRAKEELASIELRKNQLLILIDGEPIVPPVDELAQRRTRAAGVAKYRNPADPSQTWTGRGKTPGWITGDKADYLIAA